MLRYKTGVAGSGAAGASRALYLTGETLRPEKQDLAQYYLGETAPDPLTLTGMEALGQAVLDGNIPFGEATDMLVRAHGSLFGYPEDLGGLEDRVGMRIADAAARADMRDALAAEGGTVARVRRDLDPRLAERLGIDTQRPLTVTEIGRLLTGHRADGRPVEGRQIQKSMRTVVEVFGLDAKRLPTSTEVDHVLAGRRVDGEVPKDSKGVPLPDPVVQGARKRFLAAYEMPARRDLDAAQIGHIKAGRTANGGLLNAADVLAKLNATKSPISHVDMIWSADKSVSVAWALANTEAERSIIHQAHQDAVAAAMAYAEDRLGFTSKGKAARDGVEKGVTAWIAFDHYTARPTAEFARVDANGQVYTEFQDVPMRTADMQVHTHATLLNAVMTESGRIGAMDLDGLDGLVKELGATYQAFLARNLRAHGIDTRMDPATGAAVITAVPAYVSRHFSKRTQDVQEAARAYARAEGVDWDSLSPARQIGLLRKGVEETRHEKAKGGDGSDFAEWRKQAADEIGYHHRSVLRPDEIKPELSPDERHALAYTRSLDLIEMALATRAKLGAQDFREFAARGLIEAGIGDAPDRDIRAVMRLYRDHGVRQDGEMTKIWFGKDIPVRGKERWSVTTEMHAAGEQRVIDLARTFAADRSMALAPAAMERAAQTFLRAHPKIDPDGAHWKAQRAVSDQLGTGAKLGIAVGVAGAGKSTLIGVVAQAMQDADRPVHGVAVGWKQANALTEAGIDRRNIRALEAFFSAERRGKISLDEKSVVVVEEISQVGRGHMLKLLTLQQKHGFTLLAIGDPKQIGSIEPPALDLLLATLGDKVPEILTSIRQRTDRERNIAGLFRDGKAEEAIALKLEDRTAELVAGGREPTIARVAAKWAELMEGGVEVTIGVATNKDANDIGLAIRSRLQAAGKIEPDQIVLSVLLRGETGVQKLPLGVGDRVRLFNRVWSGGHFASNGDVVDVISVSTTGMTARNAAGAEAFIAWDKLQRDHEAAPRLAYGHALTVNAAQGITTRGVHIDAMVSGSMAHAGGRGYVNESRATETTLLIVNEAAERRKIASRIPRGEYRPIREADIWGEVASNLNRPAQKASALDFLRRGVDLQRGATTALPVSHIRSEVRGQTGYERGLGHHHRQRLMQARARVLHHVAEIAHRISQRWERQQHRPLAPSRGPSLRL